MANPSSPKRAVDRHTRLGAGTRVLTVVVAMPMQIVRWLGQISRAAARPVGRAARWAVRIMVAIGRPVGRALLRVTPHVVAIIRWCARCSSIIGRVVGRVVGFLAEMLGRGMHLLIRAIEAFLRPIGRVARAVARLVTGIVCSVGGRIARRVVAIGQVLMLMVEAVLGPIAHWLRAAGALVAEMTEVAVGWVVHVLTPLCRPIAGWMTRLLGSGARWLRRSATSSGRRIWQIAARFARVGRSIGTWIGARAVRVLYRVRVATARARAQHTVGIEDATHAEDLPAPRTGSGAMPCAIEVFHNPYLASGATTVDAIVAVSAGRSAGATPDAAPERAEVILVDCSGSMGTPWRKIRHARIATAAAVDALPDGTWFAIVRANHDAEVVYPRHGGLARKTPETMAAVHRALRLLWPEGGTAMGRWLLAARQLFALRPDAIAHATLLTDGHNETETSDELAAAIERCLGSFQCDCRGVGDDWNVEELRRIASSLLGTVDIVREPEELLAEFTAMMETAMSKSVDEVALRVWAPRGAEVLFVKQVAPYLDDLTDRRTAVDDLVSEYPTGAWGEETRDYHVRIRVPDREAGEYMLAGRVAVVVNGNAVAEGKVLAEWTDDEALSTRLSPEVAHARGQADLASAIARGIEAWHAGDTAGATRHLGRAITLAAATGDTVRLDQLRTIVDIDDAGAGRVRLRDDARRIDLMTLDTSSTKTMRVARTDDEDQPHSRLREPA